MRIIGISGQKRDGAEAAALHLTQQHRMFYCDLTVIGFYQPHLTIRTMYQALQECRIYGDSMFAGMLVYPVMDLSEHQWIKKHGGHLVHVTAQQVNGSVPSLDMRVVRNVDTLETLYRKLDDLIIEIKQGEEQCRQQCNTCLPSSA